MLEIAYNAQESPLTASIIHTLTSTAPKLRNPLNCAAVTFVTCELHLWRVWASDDGTNPAGYAITQTAVWRLRFHQEKLCKNSTALFSIMKHDICFFTEAIRKQRAKCREDGRKSLAQTWDRYHLMTLQFSRAVYGTSSHVNVHPATNATSGFLGVSRNSSRIPPQHPMTTQEQQLLPETLTAPQY